MVRGEAVARLLMPDEQDYFVLPTSLSALGRADLSAKRFK